MDGKFMIMEGMRGRMFSESHDELMRIACTASLTNVANRVQGAV
jgi:hypothetical protein